MTTAGVLVLGGTGYYGQRVMDALRGADVGPVVSAARHRADVRVDLDDPSTFSVLRDYAAVVNASDSVRAKPDAAMRYALAEGVLWVEMGADPELARRALALDVAPARGTVVLGAGIFPGLSTALAVELAGTDAERVELGIRLSPLSGAGGGNCALMTHTLALPSVRYEAGVRRSGRTVGPRAEVPFYDGAAEAAELALPDVDLIAAATKAPEVRARFALQPGVLLHGFRALGWLADRLGTLRGGLLAASYVFLLALRAGLLRRVSSPVDLSVVVHGPSGTRQRLVRVPDGTQGAALALAVFVRELLPRPLPTGVAVAGQLVSAQALVAGMRALGGADVCLERSEA